MKFFLSEVCSRNGEAVEVVSLFNSRFNCLSDDERSQDASKIRLGKGMKIFGAKKNCIIWTFSSKDVKKEL